MVTTSELPGAPSGEYGRQMMAMYGEISTSYRAVDDFRTKLLGLIPVVTGAGVGLLLGDNAGRPQPFWIAVGVFGTVTTFGLFCYELHGIKKCGYLIDAGARIEQALELHGQFRSRPQQVAGLIDEPLAAAVVYPAVLAGWTFVALDYASAALAIGVASAVFALGLFFSLWLIRCMEADLRARFQYATEPCCNKRLRAERDRLRAARAAVPCAPDQEVTADASMAPVGGDEDAPEHSPGSSG